MQHVKLKVKLSNAPLKSLMVLRSYEFSCFDFDDA